MKSPKSPSEINSSVMWHQQQPKFQDKSELLQQIRQFMRQFSQQQRLQMAKKFVHDALRYKQPRFDIITSTSQQFYKKVEQVQTSRAWQQLMNAFSFLYMYLIILDDGSSKQAYHILSPIIYCFFLLDFIMQVYHQCYDQVCRKSRFAGLFIAKIVLLVLLGLDQIFIGLKLTTVTGNYLHPFRLFRVGLPIVQNRQILRTFQSLGSTYQDMFVYFIFYTVVIISFSLIGSQMMQIQSSLELDPYKNQFNDLGKMVFIMYVTGTYDAYPDNQIPAIQSSTYYYAFFILFIFLNMFIFSSIPGSLIFDKFRETRGKLQLLDQAKMKNSLIVAFITIGEENYQMDIEKVIEFLLSFYEYRVRFIDAVTTICMKLNPNDHTSIHINEFMQLGNVLQENSSLHPPWLSDLPKWISFRKWMNDHLKINIMVQSFPYRLINSLLIIAATGNAIALLSSQNKICGMVDNAFANIFMIELLIRMIAIGPENFFNQLFSSIDFGVVVLGFILQFVDELTNQDALLRTFRIYRINFLLQAISNNKYWSFEIPIYKLLQNLFLRMAVILPIINKFTPLFLITYYVLGVIGMQIFYQAQKIPASAQNIYANFSNFKEFLNTQLYFVQVLTQAGWSSVAFDVADRLKQYFGLVMIFFCFFHLIIVLILATLIKGIVLSAFATVSTTFQQKKQEQTLQQEIAQKSKVKFDQLEAVDGLMHKFDKLTLDSVVKRQLFEAKMDKQFLKKLHNIKKRKSASRHLNNKDSLHSSFYRKFQINKELLDDLQKHTNKTQQLVFKIIQKFAREKLGASSDVMDNQQYQNKIDKICNKIQYNFQNQLHINIVDNQLLLGHLESKLSCPYSPQGKNQSAELHNAASMHMFDMHILLGMQTTWRQQKILVVGNLIDRKIITPQEGNVLIHKSFTTRGFRLDDDCTVRKTYLQGTKQKLVQKFQAEYFGNIYGKAFKEINNVTIEPLIQLESSIVYVLKNICRYPHMSMQQFFKLLSKTENTISNQLLRTGSLFKFVFQLNSDNNLWFSIKLDSHSHPHISFIKHGLWIHHSNLIERQIYYGNDLFRFEANYKKGQLLERSNLTKKLYETFESLALTLQQKQKFFGSNPQFNIYDLFFTFINVESIQRLVEKDFQISKIMVVALTKQKERTPQQQIPFEVSQIPIEKLEQSIQFKLDETESDTFEKLTQLAEQNDEQAIAREGLPFANVLNFFQEINDILTLHAPNVIHHVENLLNAQLSKLRRPQGE